MLGELYDDPYNMWCQWDGVSTLSAALSVYNVFLNIFLLFSYHFNFFNFSTTVYIIGHCLNFYL